jgi:hypothetical protein
VACYLAMGSIAQILETEEGIPTVTLALDSHVSTFRAGQSLPTPLRTEGIFADRLQDIDEAAQIGEESFDFVVEALTGDPLPDSVVREGDLFKPAQETITFQGDNYEEAVDKFNKYFLEMNWSDTLPLTPPTREKVDYLLTGTDRAPDEVIGTMKPSEGQITIETVAINAAMAGAKPEYMPVIITALELIADQPYQSWRSGHPLILVNGPISREIGINYRNRTFAPNTSSPAGGAIGRAVSLTMRNAGGFGYGLNPSNQQGLPGMLTGLVLAEAEWHPENYSFGTSYAEDLGFEKDANVVTVIGVMGQQVIDRGDEFVGVAESMPALAHHWTNSREAWEGRTAGILVMNSFMAGRVADEWGMTKQDVKEYLSENATVARDSFIRLAAGGDEANASGLARELLDTYDDRIPIAPPEGYMILSAGGWCSCVPFTLLTTDRFMDKPMSKQIDLPENWDSLIQD